MVESLLEALTINQKKKSDVYVTNALQAKACLQQASGTLWMS